MAKKQGKLSIGTSGWMYKDWGEKFYPKQLKTGHLSYYAEHFSTVELNSSFYHLPQASTFAKWREETPEQFSFAVKLSRYITHHNRLKDSREPLNNFFSRAKRMEEKLGVVLIQLPPNFKFDEKVWSKFASDIQKAADRYRLPVRFALEPRHKSWMEELPEVRKMAKRAGIALVFAHSSKIPSFKPEDENITAPFVYIRFHGPSEFGASLYGTRRLAPFAKKIRAWRGKGIDVYAYFNNDAGGHAIDDARTLLRLVQ